MRHPHDPANEPTADQERMHEMQCEIDGLKEQIAEASGLLNCASRWAISNYLRSKIEEWLDQNERIAKEFAALAKAEAVTEQE